MQILSSAKLEHICNPTTTYKERLPKNGQGLPKPVKIKRGVRKHLQKTPVAADLS